MALISLSSLNFVHKSPSQPTDLKATETSVYWSLNLHASVDSSNIRNKTGQV